MSDVTDPASPFVGYVGFVTRGVALVIDAICVNLCAFLVGAVLKLLLSLVGASHKIGVGELVAGGLLWSAVCGGLYFLFFWSVTGQTPGARVMGIRVVARGDFQPLRFSRALRRVICFYVAAIPVGIGFLPALVDDERRGWHDRLAGTVVRWAPPEWVSERQTAGRYRRDQRLPPGQTAEPPALPPAP